MPISKLREGEYDIVDWPQNEEEPQAKKARGSFAGGKGAPTPQPPRNQLHARSPEQQRSIPMWQAAFRAAALGM